MLKCIRRPSQLFFHWVFFFQLCFLQCCRIFVTVKCVVTIIQTFIQVHIYLPSLLPPARILFHICNVLRWNVSLKINLSKAPGEVVGSLTPETCSVFGVVGLDVGIIFNLFSVHFQLFSCRNQWQIVHCSNRRWTVILNSNFHVQHALRATW